MNMNPMQMIQMLKNGGNPQAMVMNMLRQQAGTNPMAKNMLEMAEKGDTKGIENLARNICAEKGINPDEAMNQIKQQFGMR